MHAALQYGTPMDDVTPGTLVETKLHPPAPRPGGLSRARLSARVGALLDVPLTLVSAPAGFGKTTLVGEWVRALPAEVGLGWVALDEADTDTARFARYLQAAVERATPEAGAEPRALSLEALVERVPNRLLASPHPAVIVLDDYHLIEEPRVHAAIASIVERLPVNAHLVIATRRDPPLPLSRLRARGLLGEVRADDLRFTGEEVAHFLRDTMTLPLDDAAVAALEARTEGWAAALQLAAVTIRQRGPGVDVARAFGGATPFVFDYLADEVFHAQPGAIQHFLLQTSILERVSGALCDAVTLGARGRQILRALHRGNLLTVALDEEGEWYRYHHLFRDFLRRLAVDQLGDELRALHLRAAEWFAGRGLMDEAVPQALASGDVPRAVELIERALPPATLRGEYEAGGVSGWLRELPRDIIEGRPRLAVPHAVALLMGGRVAEADAIASRVRAVVDGRSPAPHPMSARELAGHRAALGLIDAYVQRYRGRPAEAMAAAGAALATLPSAEDGPRSWLLFIRAVLLHEARSPEADAAIRDTIERCFVSGHLSGATGLMMIEAYRLLLRGRLTEMDEYLALALDRAYERHALPALNSLHAIAADLWYERNDLEEAERHARRALDLGWEVSGPRLFASPGATLVRVQAARGEAEAALRTLEAWWQRARLTELEQGRHLFPAIHADLRMLLGDTAATQAWADAEPGRGIADEIDEYTTLVRARSWRRLGRIAEARALADRALATAESSGRHGRVLQARLQVALATDALGRRAEALELIAPAIRDAAREGYARSFIDEGEPVRALLAGLLLSGADADWRSALIGAREAVVDAPRDTGVDALSEREVEVLRHLAEGMSNRAIADALIVSVDTVKTHLKNAYAKMDVHSRTQAVSRARQRGLL